MPPSPDGGPDGGGLVAAKVVQDDDIAGMQRGDQHLLGKDAEDVRVDRAVEDPGRVDPVMAQRSEEGHGIPVAKPGLGEHAMTALTAASQRSHVGLGPCLINEDKVLRINRALILLPPCPLARDIGAVLFTGQHAFFEAEASPAQIAPNGIVRDLYAFGPKLVARRRP